MLPRPIRFLLMSAVLSGLAACVIVTPDRVTNYLTALTATQDRVVIRVGQERDLLPFIRMRRTRSVPFRRLTWEVSNPAILSVDSGTGRARGLSAGTAVVQVKASPEYNGAAQLIIEVVGEEAPEVEDISVFPSDHAMAVGEEVPMQAQVQLPDGQINGNVLWSSSDTTLIAINASNGVATALRPGRVTVVAAYAPYPAFKGIAEITIYATRADIPPSPAPTLTPATPARKPRSTPTPRLRTPAPIRSPLRRTPRPTSSPGTPTPPPSPENSTPPINANALLNTWVGRFSGYQDGLAEQARLTYPNGVAFLPDGRLVVADTGNHRIRLVSPEGRVSTLAGSAAGWSDGPGAAARFRRPTGLAIGGDGDIYVADTGNHCIRRITLAGEVSTLAGSSAGYTDGAPNEARFLSPSGVVWHPDGRVLVADQSNHCIRAIALDGSVTTLAGAAVEAGVTDGVGSTARFKQPRALTLDPLGHLYVSDSDRIRRVSPEGLVTTVFAPQTAPAGLGRLRSPGGLTPDLRGGLWVADSGNHRILEILPDGTVNIWVGREAGFADGPAGDALLHQPGGLVFAEDGTLVIADTRNHRLRRLQR